MDRRLVARALAYVPERFVLRRHSAQRRLDARCALGPRQGVPEADDHPQAGRSSRRSSAARAGRGRARIPSGVGRRDPDACPESRCVRGAGSRGRRRPGPPRGPLDEDGCPPAGRRHGRAAAAAARHAERRQEFHVQAGTAPRALPYRRRGRRNVAGGRRRSRRRADGVAGADVDPPLQAAAARGPAAESAQPRLRPAGLRQAGLSEAGHGIPSRSPGRHAVLRRRRRRPPPRRQGRGPHHHRHARAIHDLSRRRAADPSRPRTGHEGRRRPHRGRPTGRGVSDQLRFAARPGAPCGGPSSVSPPGSSLR